MFQINMISEVSYLIIKINQNKNIHLHKFRFHYTWK